MYDFIEFNNFAKTRHQEMVNEATTYRRFLRKQNNSVQTFCSRLINLGQRLKSQRTTTVRPALTLK